MSKHQSYFSNQSLLIQDSWSASDSMVVWSHATFYEPLRNQNDVNEGVMSIVLHSDRF